MSTNESPTEFRDLSEAAPCLDCERHLGGEPSDQQTSESADRAHEGLGRVQSEEFGFTEEPPALTIEDVIERAKTDPGAPFEYIDFFNELRHRNPADWERARARLKKIDGVRVSAVEQAMDSSGGPRGGDEEGENSQADTLVRLAAEAELFVTSKKPETAYADIIVSGHRETLAVGGDRFRRWIINKYYVDQRGRAPNGEALTNALATIEAKAHATGQVRDVFVRVAEHEGKTYLDLADDAWRAVEIDADGWRLVTDPPVRFRRSETMLPLPVPVSGGSVDELRGVLNTKGEQDFTLAVHWVLGTFHLKGALPVLAASGEHGSAKTSFCRVLRNIIDPHDAGLVSPPTTIALYLFWLSIPGSLRSITLAQSPHGCPMSCAA